MAWIPQPTFSKSFVAEVPLILNNTFNSGTAIRITKKRRIRDIFIKPKTSGSYFYSIYLLNIYSQILFAELGSGIVSLAGKIQKTGKNERVYIHDGNESIDISIGIINNTGYSAEFSVYINYDLWED